MARALIITWAVVMTAAVAWVASIDVRLLAALHAWTW